MRGRLHGEFNDAEGLAGLVQQRMIGRLDPDRLARFGDALEFGAAELSGAQIIPEGAVFGAAALARIDEDGVFLADDLVKAIAHRLQKAVVRREDRPFKVELNHRLRAVQGLESRAMHRAFARK